MTRVVGVHGIGNYLPELKSARDAARAKSILWGQALSKSEHFNTAGSKLEMQVAYYAHLLQLPGRQGDDEIEEDVAEMWAEYVADYLPYQSQGKVRMALHSATAQMARAFGRNEQASVTFFEVFFREVGRFLRTEGNFTPKSAVLAAVGSAIHGADIVVAHSLGSVVAYEALWKYRTEVPLLVTLGSPLALPMVLPRLIPAPVDGFGARPPKVERWINIADPEDFIAMPRHGVRMHFRDLDEHRDERLDSRSHHEVVEYLQGPALGRALTEVHDLRPE